MTGSEAVNGEWVRESAAGVSVPRLRTWERLQDPQSVLVLAHPPVPEGRFRPNLVIRVQPDEGATLTRLATAAIASTMALGDGVHVLSNEATHVGPLPARKQKFVYHAAGQTVCVDRWLLVAGGEAIEASASYAVPDYVGMEGLFAHMISELEYAGSRAEVNGAAAGAADSGGIGSVAPKEPRLDELASAAAGEAREDLAAIQTAQPYRCQGPVLTSAALHLLMALADGGRVGRFASAADKAALAELVQAGLAENNGRLTDAGETITTPWRTPGAGFILAARHGELSTGIQVWTGDGLAILSAGPNPYQPEQSAIAPGKQQLDLVDAAQLPMLLASWCALAPAWSLPDSGLTIPGPVFEARMASAAEPVPAGVGDGVRRMWEQPWTGWNLRYPGAPASQSWLNAGAAGHYAVQADEAGAVTLTPSSSAVVWDGLVRFIHGTLNGSAR